jgi:hypothetical protein
MTTKALTRNERTSRCLPACLVALAAVAVCAPSDRAMSGRMTFTAGHGAIPQTPGTYPLFGDWAYSRDAPVTCEFTVRPDTAYQVFIGLTEAYWDTPGKRIMDVVINGSTVATLDSCFKEKTPPWPRLSRAEHHDRPDSRCAQAEPQGGRHESRRMRIPAFPRRPRTRS